jgi:hypothetical protein
VFAAVVVDLAGVGAFTAARVPSNPIGWLMTAAGLAAGLSFYGGSYAQFAHQVLHRDVPLEALGAWFGSWLFGPTLGGLAIFLLLLFPTGRFCRRDGATPDGLASLACHCRWPGWRSRPGR